MKESLKFIITLIGALTLLLAFQNCGMQIEEQEDVSQAPSSSEGSSSSNGTSTDNPINLSGMSGYGGISQDSSGSASSRVGGSNVNLGGTGGSGGSAGFGGEIAGGGSGSVGWDYGETQFRMSSLYPAAPEGSSVLSKNRYYFENIAALGNEIRYMWMAFANVRASTNPQTPGAVERNTLIVISLRKLSENASDITYGMTGTSLCYHFSATVTSSVAPVTYAWSRETRNNSNSYSITGYRTSLSSVNIVRKAPDEMTWLEDSACSGLSSSDLGAVNSFINIMRSYYVFSGDSSTIYMKDWNGSTSSNTTSYVLKKF